MSAPSGPSAFLSGFSDALAGLVEAVSPAVVALKVGRAGGSGFFVTPDAYVLTNSHVVGAAREARVVLRDGEDLPADVVGRDPRSDLALVRVRGVASPRPLALIPERRVRSGQLVLALGSPLQFERSVSVGVVSAIDRTLPSGRGAALEGLIQTDAAINPGNSGGPLVSADGEVVGINTAIIPFAQGLGFAVAGYTAHWVVGELLSRGRVRRRVIGIEAHGVDVPARSNPERTPRRAIEVVRVHQGSPADRAGLRRGDLITRLGGVTLWNIDDLQRSLATTDDRALPLELLRSERLQRLFVFPNTLSDAA